MVPHVRGFIVSCVLVVGGCGGSAGSGPTTTSPAVGILATAWKSASADVQTATCSEYLNLHAATVTKQMMKVDPSVTEDDAKAFLVSVCVDPIEARCPGTGSVLVTYLAGGTAHSADLTMATTSGTSQQTVAIPLTSGGSKNKRRGISFCAGVDEFRYISVQNNGVGTISCAIEVDGIVVSRNESSGQFAIAQCE